MSIDKYKYIHSPQIAGQPQNFAIFFFLFSNQRWWFGLVSVGWGCEELIDGVGICKKAISLLRVYKNIPLTLPSARPHMHIHIFLLLSHWYLICVFTIGRRNGQWLTGGKNQYISEWAKNVTILKKKKFNVYEGKSGTGCLLSFTQKCTHFLRLLSLSFPGEGEGNLG